PRQVQRRIFTKAQARVCGNGRGIDAAQLFGGIKAGNARRVQRGLADVGLVEKVLGPVKTDTGQAEADDVIGALKYFPRRGGCGEEVFAHSQDLSALAGTEDEGIACHKVANSISRKTPRKRGR